MSLIIAAVLSLAYVLPILGGKQLRDLPFVKIFTIAFVWAFVTIVLPVQEYEVKTDARIMLMFFEKILFIFSLTIPFDIRDMDWDAKTDVKTIPLSMGARNAKFLSILFLLNCIGIAIVLNKQGFYSLINMIALLISYLVSIIVIGFTRKNRSDYFFYGLTDGMMILQSLLIFMFNTLII